MSALMLKVIACIAMLIDHVGFQYGIMFFRAIGRMAFPIFVFLLCNGYRYTSNKKLYVLRLAVFAMLSQIPFSLFCYGVCWQSHGNVMFTLLLAFLCIWSADELRTLPNYRWLTLLPALVICVMYHMDFMSSDYGAKGILFALIFYFFEGKSLCERLVIIVSMTIVVFYEFVLSFGVSLVRVLIVREFLIPQLSRWDLYQVFSLLALIFIFCYNGKIGKFSGKIVQYSFYAFYPLHQLVLWMIRYI